MTKNHPNMLLVEGAQEKRLIPELMEANGVNWGTTKNPIVYIEDCGGFNNLVRPDEISTSLNESGLSALGIIIDADDNPSGRWRSIRNAALTSVPTIPESLPKEGLIISTPDGIKFGIWMMPNNEMCGMLETFITYLIPTESEEVWSFAQEVAQEAKNRGAKFKDSHLDKANIYTWLAWQDPPGRQLHNAITKRILDPNHDDAQKFVRWFKALYNIP
jgi:hypothetical protein